jgi:hypothetical protein
MQYVSDAVAARMTWRAAIARRCVRADTPLAREIADVQGCRHEEGSGIVDIPAAGDWGPATPELVSQVQLRLRGGGVLLHSEYALSDASGSRVVSLEAAVLSPAEAQGLR